MEKASLPKNEKERLEAVKFYDLLDSQNEAIFDSLTKLVAKIYDVPYCLISIIDSERQWFKSCFGLDATETPRDISFCAHAIHTPETFIVSDARVDKKFTDNPAVTGELKVVFYAGQPLIDANGYALGTLCIVDTKPRSLGQDDLEELVIVAEQIVHLIQLRKEKILKEKTQSLLSKLSENVPGAIYTFQLNADGTNCVPFTSPKLQDIFEVDLESLSLDATPIFSRIHPNDLTRVNESISESAATMTTWTCDFRVLLPNKGERWLKGHSNPEARPDGSILWHGFINDITEAKVKDDIFKHSTQMATLGEISAGIAHEVNNPLSVIITSLKLLPRYINNPEKFHQTIARLEKSSGRIAKIISGLKKYSRSSPRKEYETHILSTIAEEAVSLTSMKARTIGAAVMVEICSKSQVLCDEIEIEQVLINLINNALEATISLDDKWVKVEVYDQNQFVCFRVTDSGQGIPEEVQKKIFNPFFTTKDIGVGTGLGLSISKGILDQHKATIEILSNLPNTCFEIRFLRH